MRLKPKHLSEIYLYIASPHSGEVRITKMVFYGKRTTYRQVTGDDQSGVDFLGHWGCFSLGADGAWRLTGRNETRNETSNIERMIDDPYARWETSWKAAHARLLDDLARLIKLHKTECARFTELLARAEHVSDPKIEGKRRLAITRGKR